MRKNQRLQLKYLDKANGTMLWHLPDKPIKSKTVHPEETLASLLSPSSNKSDIKKINQALELLKQIKDDNELDD
ncbi:hypothetical protein [Bacillus solimangrovi]|uniref:Uncharacterized protein n=1 Tax=Bacillus solimangrovi TaxID=1305675 RepID=A0A1E5LJS8_9BACI|nr:hypothetical protein [Bacillus solimangrovi]OEH94321.1 hypothetical protein BFG57_08680 [Bacillus solimangrovi]